MKGFMVLMVFAMVALPARSAMAWDIDRDDPVLDPPSVDMPIADWMPEPTPVAPPEGIYLVTDVYAGDSVVQSGPVTTYTTETVHEITGSYARVLESVGTGDASRLDGSSFNGRASLSDGRSVAGTYYENFALTEYGFVPVSVVFFQDDSELARSAAPQPAAQPAPPTSPTAPGVAPSPGMAPVESPIKAGEPPIFGYVPSFEEPDRGQASALTPTSSSALPDRAVEVLRGRRISIFFTGADVRAWRAISTEGVALGPLSGSAAQPFVSRWDHLAPPSASWVARFAIDYTDGVTRDLVIRVMVRAPGLVE